MSTEAKTGDPEQDLRQSTPEEFLRTLYEGFSSLYKSTDLRLRERQVVSVLRLSVLREVVDEGFYRSKAQVLHEGLVGLQNGDHGPAIAALEDVVRLSEGMSEGPFSERSQLIHEVAAANLTKLQG